MKQKIIFVDFDDTIFIWRHDYERYNNITESLLLGHDAYSEVGRLNNILVNELVKCKFISTIIMLSHCHTAIEFNGKVKYLNKICPGLFDEYLFSGGSSDKLKVMETYQNVYSLSNKDIMLIDDLGVTREEVSARGWQARTPMEVMLDGVIW